MPATRPTRSAVALLVVTLVLLIGAVMAPSAATGSSADERSSIRLVNQTRAAAGLGPLAVHPELTAQARAWSASMAAADHLAHSPDIAAGISAPWTVLGENVGVHGVVDVGQVHDAFLASPGHYQNLVDPRYTHIGVGVVVTADGKLWTTHRFMAIEPAPTTEAPPPTAPPTSAPSERTTAPPASAPPTTTPPTSAPSERTTAPTRPAHHRPSDDTADQRTVRANHRPADRRRSGGHDTIASRAGHRQRHRHRHRHRPGGWRDRHPRRDDRARSVGPGHRRADPDRSGRGRSLTSTVPADGDGRSASLDEELDDAGHEDGQHQEAECDDDRRAHDRVRVPVAPPRRPKRAIRLATGPS